MSKCHFFWIWAVITLWRMKSDQGIVGAYDCSLFIHPLRTCQFKMNCLAAVHFSVSRNKAPSIQFNPLSSSRRPWSISDHHRVVLNLFIRGLDWTGMAWVDLWISSLLRQEHLSAVLIIAKQQSTASKLQKKLFALCFDKKWIGLDHAEKACPPEHRCLYSRKAFIINEMICHVESRHNHT